MANSFSSSILKLVSENLYLLFAKIGFVKSSNSDASGKVHLSHSIQFVEGGVQKKVSSLFPGKVKKGAKCLVVYPDNSLDRAFAISFSEFESFSTLIGDKTLVRVDDVETSIKIENGMELVASSSGVTVKFNQFTFQLGLTKASLSNDSLKVELDSLASKIQLSGDVDIVGDVSVDGKLTATKNIESDEDVKAGVISLKNHTHNYTDSPVGPSVTGVAN